MSIPEFNFKGVPLTDDNMRTLTGFLMNTQEEKPLGEDELLSGEFATQMILKRFEAYGLKFQITNFFLVASLMTFADSPGKIMIMLWTAFQYWKKKGKDVIGIEDWCLIFPDGTPTDEECHVFWDSQKKEGEHLGNMLDNPEYWV